jgi:AcrR family transcriptional regulator
MASLTITNTEEKTITRQIRKKNRTHVGIMHSAKRLFEEKGLGNVTIEEITEAADVSRSTFFSHFASLEALSTEIAGVAIEEILDAVSKSGKKGVEGINALIGKLVDDTCPYPYLTAELLINGIVKSRGKSAFTGFESLIESGLSEEGITDKKEQKEKAAWIMGAYFGTVFQKLIAGEAFDKPEELKKSIKNFVNNLIGR